MLEIKALTYNDLAPVLPVFGRVGLEGGTIGRGEGNDIALPDPMRLISRRHLRVDADGTGGWQLVNISSANLVYVNDTELKAGHGCPLLVGDKIYIGGYVLQVSAVKDMHLQSMRGTGPDSADGTLIKEKRQEPEASSGDDTVAADDLDAYLTQSDAIGKFDPLQMLHANGVDLHDIAGKGDALIRGYDGVDHAKELIRDDFSIASSKILKDDVTDPLALFGGESDLLKGLINSPPSTSGDVGLSTTGVGDLIKVPKTSSSESGNQVPTEPQEYIFEAASKNKEDPLDAFLEGLMHDDHEGSLEEKEDRERLALEKNTSDMQEHPSVSSENVIGENLIDSFSERLAPQVPFAEVRSISSAELEEKPVASNDSDVLYQAFLRGLGLKEIPDRKALDANFMYLLGKLLRCTTQGTVDLIAGRAIVKREVKANVTLIAPERNNPLKFSPDGEVALMYLLGRKYPGFMEPVEAVSGAYLDLRAHQMGLVSGMRSALGHVLEKFDPQVIDAGHDPKRTLPGLAIVRKARLWEAYQDHFQTTKNEAQDRFQEFFGAAFLKAYEEATQTLNAQHGMPGGRP